MTCFWSAAENDALNIKKSTQLVLMTLDVLCELAREDVKRQRRLSDESDVADAVVEDLLSVDATARLVERRDTSALVRARRRVSFVVMTSPL